MIEDSFSTKDPAADRTFSFGMPGWLEPGETLTGVVFSMLVVSGVDANPSAMLSGAGQVSGTDVLQRVLGGIDGVTYRLRAVVTTSNPHTLVVSALLPVHSV